MERDRYLDYIIGRTTLLHAEDLEHAANPAEMLSRRGVEVLRSLEPSIQEAWRRHVRVDATDDSVLACTEIRAEIAIMPAGELRSLLGMVEALKDAARRNRLPTHYQKGSA